MKTHIDNTIPNKKTGRLNLVNRKMDNDIYKIIEENEGGEISEFVVALKKYILAEKEKYAEERVREFAMGLIDQLKNHTIVDQYDDETDSTAPIEETKLVSDILRKTAVEIVEMFLAMEVAEVFLKDFDKDKENKE